MSGNLSDEQRRELGFARDMRDMLSIVERIVTEQVEAAEADKREILDTAIRYKRERNEARAAERDLVERLSSVPDRIFSDFEALAAKVKDYNGNLVGYHITPEALRTLRSRLRAAIQPEPARCCPDATTTSCPFHGPMKEAKDG